MGPTLGPVVIHEQSPLSAGGMVSEDLFNQADEDVVRILKDAEEEADRVIAEHRAALSALVSALREHETLDRVAISSLLAEVSTAPRAAAAG